MLPENIYKFRNKFPENRDSNEYKKLIDDYIEIGYDLNDIESFIVTRYDARNVMNGLGINQDSAFYEYYLDGYENPSSGEKVPLYGLQEILDEAKDPYWKQYAQIGKRYLQLSSIEGEWSYFYDRDTDAVYGVDWGEMDDFAEEKLSPLFDSFNDFLVSYYSDNNE